MKRLLKFIGAAMLTMLGWSIAWHLDRIVSDYIDNLPHVSMADRILIDLFGTYRAWVVSLGLVWLLGGSVTALALRLTSNRFKWRHMFVVTLFWLLGGFIWLTFFLQTDLYLPVIHTLHFAGLIGGIATALVVNHIQPAIRWREAALIAAGWTLARSVVAGGSPIEISLNRFLYAI